MGKNDVEFKISAKNLSRKELKVLKNDLKAAGVQIKAFNKQGLKVAETGRKMKAAGQKMAIGAGIAGAAITVLTKKFVTFENGIGRVAALTNKDLIPTMEKFGPGVEKSSIAAATGVDELNQSLFDLISGGVKEADALKILEFSAKGARGAYSDLNSVVTGNIAIMNSFKIGAEGVPRIMDQINLAADKGITTFGKLGNNIGKVAATAASYKISSGDLLASISATTTTGISTEQSVTQIKALLNAITTPTTEATKALDILQKGTPAAERIALSVESLQKEGLLNYFNKLQNTTKGSAVAIKALFGANQEASNGLNVLIQKSKLFNETAVEMNNVGDDGALTMRKFAIASQTAQFKLDKTKQEIAATARELGRALLPAVLKVAKGFSVIVKGVGRFIKEHRTAATVVAGLTVALTVFLAVGGGLLIFVGQIAIAFEALAVAMGGLKVAMMGFSVGAVAAPFAIAAAVVLGLVAAIEILNTEIDKVTERQNKRRTVKTIGGDGPDPGHGLTDFNASDMAYKDKNALTAQEKASIEKQLEANTNRKMDYTKDLLKTPKAVAESTGGFHQELVVEEVKKSEKKKTDVIKDEIKNRTKAEIDAINKKLAAALGGNKKLEKDAQKKGIDLFAPGISFITDAVSSTLSAAGGSGFIGKNVPTGSTTTKKSININVELPNVTNTTEFIEEMNRKSDSLSFAG